MMRSLFAMTFLVCAMAAGLIGCSPVDCELNPNQPECHEDDAEDTDDVPSYVQVARGRVQGDPKVALIEQTLAPLPAGSMPQGVLLFVPPLKVTQPEWRIQTSSASWRWHEPTPNGAKYLFADTAGYVRVGRWVPAGTTCGATKVEGDRLQCRGPSGAAVVFVCPYATIGKPLAYSEKPGGSFKYDFDSRFLMTEWPLPKANRVTVGTGLQANGTQAPIIYCQYPLANRTITLFRF